MSAKVKLISFISAFVLVLGIMIIGVLSAEQVKVNIGGSVSFNATNVYAKVSGNISGAQTGNKIFSTLTYSAEETTGNESDWTNLALEFTETPDPIEITITVENLSTQRTLTANLTNTLSASGLNIAITRDSGIYSSGTNFELPVSTGDGSSTTTFTLTLTVADPNEDLTDVNFGYILNMYDENYTPPPTSASSFTFSFNDTDHTATIADFIGSETEVIIPSTVNKVESTTATEGSDYTVIGIGSYAFQGCSSLTSITIPDSVTSLGYNAFSYCSSLTSVTIGKGVTSLGGFNHCTALTEINYNATAANDFHNHAEVFAYCGQNSEGITVNIGANVTKIPAYFFGSGYIYGSVNIVAVNFADNSVCESIGESAFSGCDNLRTISFGNNNQLTSIGDFAFEGCSSLESIYLNCPSLVSIGVSAFACEALVSIDFSLCENLTYFGGTNGYESGVSMFGFISIDEGTSVPNLEKIYLNKYLYEGHDEAFINLFETYFYYYQRNIYLYVPVPIDEVLENIYNFYAYDYVEEENLAGELIEYAVYTI